MYYIIFKLSALYHILELTNVYYEPVLEWMTGEKKYATPPTQ